MSDGNVTTTGPSEAILRTAGGRIERGPARPVRAPSDRYTETLRLVRGLLDDPTRWTWGTEAVDGDGWPVRHDSPHAVSRCLRGAVRAVSGDDGTVLARLDRDVRRATRDPNTTAAHHNDLHGHEGVVRLLDLLLRTGSGGA